MSSKEEQQSPDQLQHQRETRLQEQLHQRNQQAQRDAFELEQQKLRVESAKTASQSEVRLQLVTGFTVAFVAALLLCAFLATDCSESDRHGCLAQCNLSRLTGTDFQACTAVCTANHSWRPWTR